jgi:hypothetical protein
MLIAVKLKTGLPEQIINPIFNGPTAVVPGHPDFS